MIVQKHIGRAKNKQKMCFDRRAKATKIGSGDRVLVKILIPQWTKTMKINLKMSCILCISQ